MLANPESPRCRAAFPAHHLPPGASECDFPRSSRNRRARFRSPRLRRDSVALRPLQSGALPARLRPPPAPQPKPEAYRHAARTLLPIYRNRACGRGAGQRRGSGAAAPPLRPRRPNGARSKPPAPGRSKCCGRGQSVMSSVPSGLTRVSAGIAAPCAAARFLRRKRAQEKVRRLRRSSQPGATVRPSRSARSRLKRT